MGIFDKIKGAIWGSSAPEKPAEPKPQVNPTPTQTASAGSTGAAPTPAPAPAQTSPAPTPTASTPAAPPASPPPTPTAGTPASPAPTADASSPPAASASGGTPGHGTPAQGNVDVAAIMDAAVKKKGQKLDWRHSIVDMMKALDLDSDLAARKELAEELNYTGDKSDSAKMNVWLHKALMQKLAENGGKVPTELTD